MKEIHIHTSFGLMQMSEIVLYLISGHLWKLAHTYFLSFHLIVFYTFFLVWTFLIGFLWWYQILELSCITLPWQAWRSLFENNLIIDHWEGPYGCVAVSDKTSKKRITVGESGLHGCSQSFFQFPEWQLDRQAFVWGGQRDIGILHDVVLCKV